MSSVRRFGDGPANRPDDGPDGGADHGLDDRPDDGLADGPAPGWIRGVRSVTVLTGAGISTDSGIPDFRGPQGLWTRDPEAEKLSSIEHYMADPEIRRRAWQARRDHPAWSAEPNAAHRAIAGLERAGIGTWVITQNTDGLHQQAGTPPGKVLELHGSTFGVICTGCGDRTEMTDAVERLDAGESDPDCRRCGSILKAATVLFGEPLDQDVLEQSATRAAECDLFLAVGSTLTVEPAASLCGIAAAGAVLVVVNRDPTPYDDVATAVIREPIGTAVPRIAVWLEKEINAS